MPNKFTNIPIEPDTRILYRKENKLDGYDFESVGLSHAIIFVMDFIGRIHRQN